MADDVNVGKQVDNCLITVMVVADLVRFKSMLATTLFMLSNGFSPLVDFAPWPPSSAVTELPLFTALELGFFCTAWSTL